MEKNVNSLKWEQFPCFEFFEYMDSLENATNDKNKENKETKEMKENEKENLDLDLEAFELIHTKKIPKEWANINWNLSAEQIFCRNLAVTGLLRNQRSELGTKGDDRSGSFGRIEASVQ